MASTQVVCPVCNRAVLRVAYVRPKGERSFKRVGLWCERCKNFIGDKIPNDPP